MWISHFILGQFRRFLSLPSHFSTGPKCFVLRYKKRFWTRCIKVRSGLFERFTSRKAGETVVEDTLRDAIFTPHLGTG